MEERELNQDLLKLQITLYMKLEFGKNRVLSISKLKVAKIILLVIFSSMDQELELISMMDSEETVNLLKIFFLTPAENLVIMGHLTVGIDKLT